MFDKNFSNDRIDIFFRIFELIRQSKLTFLEGLDENQQTQAILDLIKKSGLDSILGNLSIKERDLVEKFFTQIIDQPPYFSSDYNKLKRLLIDWYSSHRTLASSKKESTDPYFLTEEELDELIKSFGFPYPKNIISKEYKVQFLLSLIQNYKKKGSPFVFYDALKYFGLRNLVLSEWWLTKHPNGDLFFRSKPVYPRDKRRDPSLVIEKPYQDFIDIYWHITEEEINTIYNNSPYITLPSLTPFISISSEIDTNRLKPGLAVLNQLLLENYEYWMKFILNPRRDIIKKLNDPDEPGFIAKDAIIIGNTPLKEFIGYTNYYAVKTEEGTTRNWLIMKPRKHHCIKLLETNTHHVYNGEEWIDLGILLPNDKIVDYTLNSLNNNEFYRNIYLTQFEEKYNLLEVMLAIIYLFDDVVDTTDIGYLSYKGPLSPFDKTGPDKKPDNKIDNIDHIFKVYDLYNSLSKRACRTRDERDYFYKKFQNQFERDITPIYTGNLYTVFKNCDIFLNAMNPRFKKDIDGILTYKTRKDVLFAIMNDLEFHLTKQINIIDIPFTSLILGSPIYDSLKDVVDFFKPYRVRITDFFCSYGIYDRLLDSQLEKDSITFDFILKSIDKSNSKDDLLKTTIYSRINEYIIGRSGASDPYSHFDMSLNEAIWMILKQKFQDKLTLEEKREKKLEMVFVDSCPGNQKYFDSSTILDGLDIVINYI